MVPRYLQSETLGNRRSSIYSAGLPNFIVPGMKHNENDFFLHWKLNLSASEMFACLNIPSFDELLRKYVYSFRNRLPSK